MYARRRTQQLRGRAGVFALLLALTPASAGADDGNFRPYLVGGRAAGMGGAFTALADDPSGPFYNPAGIAHVTSSQVSLSASLFGVLSGRIGDLAGQERDFEYRNLQTFPIQTSGVYKLGAGPPEQSSHACAVSIFVPNSTALDARSQVVVERNALFYSIHDDSVWSGFTYARRFGSIAFGASVYALVGTRIEQFDLAVISDDSSEFANVRFRIDELTMGVVGALGVRWDVSNDISLGASVFSPELAVYGRRAEYLRALAAVATEPPQGVALAADELPASGRQPLRLQAGFASTTGSFTLTADLIWLGPREVRDDSRRADADFDQWIKRNGVINAAVGVELLLTPRFPIRAGIWTDFSAAERPSLDGPDNTSQLDRYGMSLGAGMRSEHNESSVNLNVSKADGKELIPRDLDFTQVVLADQEQLGVYLVLSSSFQF